MIGRCLNCLVGTSSSLRRRPFRWNTLREENACSGWPQVRGIPSGLTGQSQRILTKMATDKGIPVALGQERVEPWQKAHFR